MTQNPFEFLTRHTGHWAMVFFLFSYSITPLRRWLRYWASVRKWRFGKRLVDWNFLVYNRRLLGLCCFYYATAHLLIYFYFELDFNFQELFFDIKERLFITFGFICWLILAILAITSPNFMQKRLKKKWQTIHKAVYLAIPVILCHLIFEAKTMEWHLWLYLLLFLLFSFHRLGVKILPQLINKADDGMFAKRKLNVKK